MLWIYAQLHMSQIKQIQSESICNKTKCTFLFSLSIFWCFTNLIKCLHLCLDLDSSLLSCVVYKWTTVCVPFIIYKSYIKVPHTYMSHILILLPFLQPVILDAGSFLCTLSCTGLVLVFHPSLIGIAYQCFTPLVMPWFCIVVWCCAACLPHL